MDHIEITATGPPGLGGPTGHAGPEGPNGRPQDGLRELLDRSKGRPKDYTSVEALTKGPTSLWALNGPKLQSEIKVLGAVYWVSSEVILRRPIGDKAPALKDFKQFAEVLGLAPAAMPGQWSPVVKAFYTNPKRPDVIGVPRFWGLSMFGPPQKDIRNNGTPLSSIGPDLGLRELQVVAVNNVMEALASWGGASVTADCGFGKTRLAIDLIRKCGVRTLVLCNREVLMAQWAEVIKGLVPEWTIAWMQGGPSLTRATIGPHVGPSRSHDVCVASIDTLIEGVPKDILKHYGLVIVDEAHHLAAATLVHALPMVAAKYVVGLSATPDRRDGLEHALYWLTGPAAFVYKRLPSVTGVRGSVEVNQILTHGCANREKMYANGQLAFAEMLNGLAEDPRRNKYILDALCGAIDMGRVKIIVVSSLVRHCFDLQGLLKASRPTVEACIMAGKAPETGRSKDPSTRVVFATYSLLEEGYDDPVLDTLILATPRSRIQQTIGRIERTLAGKLVPLVYDICDTFSVYPSMWYKRQAFYRSRGFAIQKDTSV